MRRCGARPAAVTRGVAAAWSGGLEALVGGGAHTLVIVVDREEHAISVYLSAGFIHARRRSASGGALSASP